MTKELTKIPEKCDNCGSTNVVEADPMVGEYDDIKSDIVVEWGFECYDCGHTDFDEISLTYTYEGK